MLKQAITEVMGEEDDIELNTASSPWPMVVAALALVIIAVVWWQQPVLTTPEPAVVPVVVEAAPVIVPEPVPEPTSAAEPEWINTKQQAVTELLTLLELDGEDFNTLCAKKTLGTPRCEQLTVKTWQALIEYNRPAVLSLITPAKMQGYAILVSIDNQQATLLLNGESEVVPLSILGTLWTGDFMFIWSPPAEYSDPFSEEYSGPMVKWLAEKFAKLDGQDSLLAENNFNAALAQRVKIFQKNHQLLDDGVVGLKTLLKMNEKIDAIKTLDTLPLDPDPVTTNTAQEG
jgi:general secretion pathway protein A